MEKRKNTAIPVGLAEQETKSFSLTQANEFETSDIITEKGAKYILLDKKNNGAKVSYKFYDETGIGFKDTFDKIIENKEGYPRLYFMADEETEIVVKRL